MWPLQQKTKAIPQQKAVMTDKQIIKIASDFRRGIIGKNTSNDRCFMVTAPLQSILDMYGIETKIIEGELELNENLHQHFWLELNDSRILDATSDQFKTPTNEEMPKVFLGQKPKWYKQLTTNK